MSPERLSIGVIEDDPIMGESLNQCLELEGYQVDWWRTGCEAMAGLGRQLPDLVICDIRLPDMSGEEVFREIARNGVAPPFLFMTAFGQIDQAVMLMRAGAGDYLTKPFKIEDLLSRTRVLAVRRWTECESLLGVSPSMRRIEGLLRRIGPRRSPVLFTGETGVGKEICARFLHAQSASRDQPFMAVNCAAIPGSLLESELFGHEKGAFTGATARHLGYAERSRQGSLFLDEVAELPAAMQAKMLRLLEDRTFHRVGGETPITLGARIVCATNRDLAAEAGAGRFRDDLLYRINVVTIEVPPLRERPEDIQWLLGRFFADAAQEVDTNFRGISSLAEEAALAHSWPGNIRELRNRVERAAALGVGDWIMPADLFPEVQQWSGRDGGETSLSLAGARDAAERRVIDQALRQTAGQIAEAAKLLGISRTTLWERMRRFGLAAE